MQYQRLEEKLKERRENPRGAVKIGSFCLLRNSRNGEKQRHRRRRDSREFTASQEELAPSVVNFEIVRLLLLRGHYCHQTFRPVVRYL